MPSLHPPPFPQFRKVMPSNRPPPRFGEVPSLCRHAKPSSFSLGILSPHPHLFANPSHPRTKILLIHPPKGTVLPSFSGYALISAFDPTSFPPHSVISSPIFLHIQCRVWTVHLLYMTPFCALGFLLFRIRVSRVAKASRPLKRQ